MMVDTIPPITLTNWNVVEGYKNNKLCSSLRINHAKIVNQSTVTKYVYSVFKIPVTLCLFLSDNLDILHICKLAYLVQLARRKL